MSELPRAAEVAIIGAGAIGCSIAYHLARRGQTDVVVLEQDLVGSGTTSKAAGGIRAQFGTEAEIRFAQASIAFFERFEEEMGARCDYRKHGYLHLVSDEADLARCRRTVAFQQAHGVEVRLIAPEDTREIVPQIDTAGLLAAVWGPGDGFAGPHEVVQAFAKRARERGVRVCEDTLVTGVEVAGDRVRALQTSRGRVEAPLVINAAGPWAARVGRMVGAELPILPRRRHIFVTDRFDGLVRPSPLVIDRASGFYCRTEGDRVLMSPGDVEDIGTAPDFRVPVDWRWQEVTAEKAVRHLPALAGAAIRSAWAGLRPVTVDDHAILDWLPGVEGMYVAGGFNGHGFQHAPAAGQVVAEVLLGHPPAIDLSLFTLARFARGVTGPAGAGED
jgi:sarcosine oxidase subunit beta